MVSRTLCRRRGFRLIDELVAFGLVAALVSLLLPALLSSRRTAQPQTQCMNNMKQISIAISNVVARDNRFPASSTWYVPDSNGNGRLDQADVLAGMDWNATSDGGIGMGYSWALEIMPFLDRSHIARRVGTMTRRPVTGEPTTTARPLPCPDSRGMPVTGSVGDGGNLWLGQPAAQGPRVSQRHLGAALIKATSAMSSMAALPIIGCWATPSSPRSPHQLKDERQRSTDASRRISSGWV